MSSLSKKYEYQNSYNRGKYKRVTVLVPLTETDILEKLEEVKSKSTYILGLIRKDIKGKK